MMRRKVLLLQIENDREISPKTDEEFFDALWRSLLLALKENGFMNEAQLRWAEEKIRTQKGNNLNFPGR